MSTTRDSLHDIVVHPIPPDTVHHEDPELDDGSLARRPSMIRVIKRYESRKLYDTEESRYVSLEDLARWVRDGQQLQVIDNATSDDVTAQILTQVILEEGKRGTSFLPTELLHELVRGGERIVTTGVHQVQDKVDELVRASIDRLGPVRRAREEMVHLRDRLTQLERTLETLEVETVKVETVKVETVKDETAAPAAAEAEKPSARKPRAKKATDVN